MPAQAGIQFVDLTGFPLKVAHVWAFYKPWIKKGPAYSRPLISRR